MKFFIDSANIDDIKTALSWGMLDGVTTNPSLVAKEGKAFLPTVTEICKLVPGPVSLETVATTSEDMVREGRKLRELGDNVVVKLAMSTDALQATKILKAEGIPVNMTLIFSPMQALMAAKTGAAFVSPFIGRLDDISHDGLTLIERLVQIFSAYSFETEILVASVRHPIHVVESAMMGADVATIPFKVLKQFAHHPLTESGTKKFIEDGKKIPGQV